MATQPLDHLDVGNLPIPRLSRGKKWRLSKAALGLPRSHKLKLNVVSIRNLKAFINFKQK
jgi:hypothetical protein